MCRVLPAILLAAALAVPAAAQRALVDIPAPDTAAELEAMEVAEGYEVNLFAADPLVRKPLQINFSPDGRLWVSSSSVYPQVRPGEIPDDTVTILEDRDGDGVADSATRFAGGLHMPTAVLPGDGGCYVANATEILHLSDTDGDGVADARRTVLSGFGTEDTHHLVHTFRWGPDSRLYFNQSIYIHSHVETPWGVRRLNGGGMWRFRPQSLELDVFARGWVNPWGHAIDGWGRSLVTDGAGGEGINLGFPGAAHVTAVGASRILHGMNPGSPKLCGLAILSGSHLPDDAQGVLVTHDFRANRVCRYRLTETGSGFTSEKLPDLIRSPRVDFRPIDVQMGPDGAIYVADWYNPIIQHGEVDFRDERRDREHGRIWRVTAKGRALVPRGDPTALSNRALFARLAGDDGYARDAARRVLVERGRGAVGPDLDAWAEEVRQPRSGGGDPAGDGDGDRRCLEALRLRQGLDDGSVAAVDAPLLARVLHAADPRARAAACRVVVDWADRLGPGVGPPGSPRPVDLLAAAVDDDSMAVRLEGVRALAAIALREPPGSEEARRAAALVLHPVDRERDDALDYAVWLAARELEPVWLPAVLAGSFDDGGRLARVLFAMRAAESATASGWLVERWRSGTVSGTELDMLVDLIALLGAPAEQRLVLDFVADPATPAVRSATVLGQQVEAHRRRRVVPEGDLAAVARMVTSPEPSLAAAAIDAAGAWQVEEAAAALATVVADTAQAPPRRRSALAALGALSGRTAHDALATVAGDRRMAEGLRGAALAALVGRSVDDAATLTAAWLGEGPGEGPIHEVLRTFLGHRGAAARLAEALADRPIPPSAARAALQDVTAAGRPEPELAAVLGAAAGAAGPTMSAAGRAAVLALVGESADAARGREIFRRAELRCVACHRIDREGGRVGPNLTAIGTAAQPDYLLESLVDPARTVKEGYGSVVVVTADGQVTSGIPVSRSDTELVLRDVLDRDIRLRLADVEEESAGTSLMPAGLVDALSPEELADLVRYLSSLGR